MKCSNCTHELHWKSESSFPVFINGRGYHPSCYTKEIDKKETKEFYDRIESEKRRIQYKDYGDNENESMGYSSV